MFGTETGAQTPWVIRMLLRAGFKNQKQAEIALLVFAVLCIMFTLFSLTQKKPPVPQNDVQQNPNYEPTRTR